MRKTVYALMLFLVPLSLFGGGINTAEDLVAFAKAVNQFQPTDQWRNEDGVVCLEADIDMSKVKKFESISSFGGVFDGKGHSIKNWKAKSGLFGTLLDGGEIRNLIIDKSCSMKTANSEEAFAVGFLVNHNRGIIRNCENHGTISHKSTYTTNDVLVGGLVGKNNAVIFNCRNYGNISSNCISTVQKGGVEFMIGGIAGGCIPPKGEMRSGFISCENFGNLKYEGDFPYAFSGGITGYSTGGPIRLCVNRGNIEVSALRGVQNLNNRTSYVGGICGYSRFEVTSCDNFGTVNSSGGIMGYCSGIVGLPSGFISVSDCINYADVVLSNEVPSRLGGIAAICTSDVRFAFCENHGEIKFAGFSPDAPSYIGGIVGEVYTKNGSTRASTLRNCLNTGNVTAGAGGNNYENDKCIHTGGIIGRSYGLSKAQIQVYGCLNNGTVTSLTGRSNPYVAGMQHTKIWGTYYDSYAKSSTLQEDGSNIYGKVMTAEGKPVKDVVISDGFQCVQTGEDGSYSMKSDLNTARFVSMSLPSGYEIERVNSIPQMFKRIRRYEKAVSADFVLTQTGPQEEYTLIMIGDPQNIGFKSSDNGCETFRDVIISDIEKQKEEGKQLYAINLGDVIYNFTAGYDDFLAMSSEASFPMFNVIGNHDLDKCGFAHPRYTNVSYENYVGPTDYSFNIGDIHYVVLNTVPLFANALQGSYTAGVSDEGLEWLKNDLSFVPKDKTIVLCSHILLIDPYRRLGRRLNETSAIELFEPFEKVYAWGGHTHTNSGGKCNWKGRKIDGVKVARATGSPRVNAPMSREGIPNGYMFVDVKGGQMEWYYKTAGKGKDHQMRVYSPTVTGDEYVKAIIWNYTPTYWSNPEWYENGVKIGELERVKEHDPAYEELFAATLNHLKGTSRNYALPVNSEYLFRIKPSADVRKGEVRVTDNFGNTFIQEIEW